MSSSTQFTLAIKKKCFLKKYKINLFFYYCIFFILLIKNILISERFFRNQRDKGSAENGWPNKLALIERARVPCGEVAWPGRRGVVVEACCRFARCCSLLSWRGKKEGEVTKQTTTLTSTRGGFRRVCNIGRRGLEGRKGGVGQKLWVTTKY